MFQVPVEEDCEGGDLAHRLVCHRDIPVRQFEGFARHLLRTHDNENVSVGHIDLLNNVRQSQSISSEMDNLSPRIAPVSNSLSPRVSGHDGKVSAESPSYFPDSRFNPLVLP